ncbi:hypothetical protein [Bradyrhizobium roseum]|uniref:hypothetical protein n=1 Tax=Bradyrhizobium roseum TaxID=3056648 RepID=UPI0026144B1C|nr:hypothetical protein [Bradyrhizobium roseus]WKA31612.1 hypothetical protein QUH67_16260 [Bradyrhizobium roseus]
MATLNIEGRKVTVDDSFLKLSPDEQNATVEEIAKSLAPRAPAAPPLLAQAAAAAPTEPIAAAAPSADGSFSDTVRAIRDAVHAPTRILENGILLGLGDRARAGMGAIIGEGRPKLSGLVTGEESGYGGLLKREQAETERFQKEHPIAAPAAEIVGGAMSPVGAIAAAGKGVSLGAKTLYAALAGGGIGGLQGGFSSKDWTDVAQTAKDTAVGGLVGGTLGAAIPGAAKVVGSGYNLIANAIRGRAEGMSRGASKHLVNAMEADTPAAVKAELQRLGLDAMLADSGPTMLGKTQGAALLSDEGRTVATNALKGRDTGTNSRIMDDVERALGPAEDPATATRNIIDYRSHVDSQNYPRVLRAAQPVRTAPLMVELEDAIISAPHGGAERRALEHLQQMLTREQLRPRPDPFAPGRQALDANGQPAFDRIRVNQDRAEVLHKVKQELDNVIEHDAPGLGIQAGALRNQQAQLKRFRHDLNQALENQVDGYARANRVSERLARRAEAVKEGTGYLGEGRTTPSPARFRDEHEQRDVGTRIAFAKGSRGEIDRKLGTKANDLQALRAELQGEGGWNTEKIATVHGDDAARQLMDTVERNLKFRDTHTKVVENSQTEIRRSAREAMKPTNAGDGPMIHSGATSTGLVATAAKKAVAAIANAMLRTDPTKSYGEVARVLTTQGAQRDAHYQAILNALERRNENSAIASTVGDRSALAASIAASALLNDRMRKHRQ